METTTGCGVGTVARMRANENIHARACAREVRGSRMTGNDRFRARRDRVARIWRGGSTAKWMALGRDRPLNGPPRGAGGRAAATPARLGTPNNGLQGV